jgi:hypothetical protein
LSFASPQTPEVGGAGTSGYQFFLAEIQRSEEPWNSTIELIANTGFPKRNAQVSPSRAFAEC